jgi:hypothetical protein
MTAMALRTVLAALLLALALPAQAQKISQEESYETANERVCLRLSAGAACLCARRRISRAQGTSQQADPSSPLRLRAIHRSI